MKKSRSPHEKKELSYERDRRNSYGENSKSSRKNIPARKREVNRVNRRSTAVPTPPPAPDAEDLHAVEEVVQTRRPKRWKKAPDTPLRDHVQRQRVRRERNVGRKKRGVAETTLINDE